MKLYVLDRSNRSKIPLKIIASDRRNLTKILGTSKFVLNGTLYSVNDVQAEPTTDNAAVGGLLGGVVGAVAGPAGIIIGGVLGAAIGQDQVDKDKREAEVFNRSML